MLIQEQELGEIITIIFQDVDDHDKTMLRLTYFPNKQQDQPHIFSLPHQTFCRRTHIRTFSIKENGGDDDTMMITMIKRDGKWKTI